MEVALMFVGVWLLLLVLYAAWPYLCRAVAIAPESDDESSFDVVRLPRFEAPPVRHAFAAFPPPRPTPAAFVPPALPEADSVALPVFKRADALVRLRSDVQPLGAELPAVTARRRAAGKRRPFSRRQAPGHGSSRPQRRQVSEVRLPRQRWSHS